MSQPTATDQPSVRDRVQAVVDWLRPIIQADGGDVELVNISTDGVVQVRLRGACVGCPSSSLTLRQGLERNIKLKVPEVRQVLAVED